MKDIIVRRKKSGVAIERKARLIGADGRVYQYLELQGGQVLAWDAVKRRQRLRDPDYFGLKLDCGEQPKAWGG